MQVSLEHFGRDQQPASMASLFKTSSSLLSEMNRSCHPLQALELDRSTDSFAPGATQSVLCHELPATLSAEGLTAQSCSVTCYPHLSPA